MSRHPESDRYRTSRGPSRWNPSPPAIYARHAAANALGLTDRYGATLIVALMDVRWSNPSDDELGATTVKELMNNIEKATSAIHLFDKFVYLNYAGPDQAPIDSYGLESIQRLRAVRDRVNPAHVFTKQVPRAFKIPSP
ncbi:hypothetical protein GGR57DRAFT_507822 [Xylariaceae sp. FL1272]|nr:hypothetical protein GGR57DRAFT_507822 [Xylariaceae sp. FL1272]